MALTSPGVQVSVIDESFYTPAEPGTTPMIFVASASNKTNASGTGIAAGTLAANAGKPYLLTSQRDLADTFGDPAFEIDNNNNPIHGSEINEYGLHAAYSFLGVSNRAWVVRADLDLNELQPSSTAPAANPAAGTYWLDTQITAWGVQEWNGESILTTGGQTFTNKTPIVITDSTLTESGSLLVNGYAGARPAGSVGEIGDYAIVATSTLLRLYYRNSAGTWVLVGSDAWTKSHPTIKGSEANPTFTAYTDDIVINGVEITVDETSTVSTIASDISTLLVNQGVTAAVVDGRLQVYSDGTSSGAEDSSTGGPVVIALAGDGGMTDDPLELLGITAGTYYPPAVQISKHTQIPEFKSTDTYTRPTGSVWIKTTEPNAGARYRVKVWNSETELWDAVEAPLYDNNESAIVGLDSTGGGTNIPVGALYVETNVAGDAQKLGTTKLMRREAVGVTSIRGSKITASTFNNSEYNLTIQSTDVGSTAFSSAVAGTIAVTPEQATTDATLIAAAITNAGVPNVSAEVDSQNRIVIKHTKGGEIRFTDTDGLLNAAGFSAFVSSTSGTPNLYYQPGTDGDTSPKQLQASNWKALTYTASDDQVTALTTDGALWYNSVVDEVDIMIHDGTNWVGYLSATSPYYDADENEQTDPAGPIVSASTPILQSDGTALKNGDLWIDTSDLENYPQIYRFNANLTNTPIANRWELLDKADQTTENGVLFADARYNTAGANSDTAGDIEDLLVSDYLDPDAPDPALYPKGMILWNLRRSGFNVKKFVRNYINTALDNERNDDEAMADYYEHRWVTESGNQNDGSGSFGRHAQRKVVVQALQALVNSNDDIRDNESRIFNLMATPGYPELIGEMISLNYDRGLTAFIVGDSPARLTPDATSLNEWATNVNIAVEDNDLGLVSRDEYLGMFYPWGFTSDNFGNNVVVPPSHMMLRTIALSDQVSYPWFAPAGTRRGGITNATSTGYIDSEGEFVAIALNEGQRDTLYTNSVNPITFITGAGLVNYGQKTRSRGTSALDRINVARLVIYLRSQLNQLAKPYIFEPNDKITRDEIKQAAESLLLELVGQRALYDFLVVCDESNNTPSRIDRNELYLDIAIEPVKAVEFIYVPLRLKNTGEISGL
jgi:hypothetical protein